MGQNSWKACITCWLISILSSSNFYAFSSSNPPIMFRHLFHLPRVININRSQISSSSFPPLMSRELTSKIDLCHDMSSLYQRSSLIEIRVSQCISPYSSCLIYINKCTVLNRRALLTLEWGTICFNDPLSMPYVSEINCFKRSKKMMLTHFPHSLPSPILSGNHTLPLFPLCLCHESQTELSVKRKP